MAESGEDSDSDTSITNDEDYQKWRKSIDVVEAAKQTLLDAEKYHESTFFAMNARREEISARKVAKAARKAFTATSDAEKAVRHSRRSHHLYLKALNSMEWSKEVVESAKIQLKEAKARAKSLKTETNDLLKRVHESSTAIIDLPSNREKEQSSSEQGPGVVNTADPHVGGQENATFDSEPFIFPFAPYSFTAFNPFLYANMWPSMYMPCTSFPQYTSEVVNVTEVVSVTEVDQAMNEASAALLEMANRTVGQPTMDESAGSSVTGLAGAEPETSATISSTREESPVIDVTSVDSDTTVPQKKTEFQLLWTQICDSNSKLYYDGSSKKDIPGDSVETGQKSSTSMPKDFQYIIRKLQPMSDSSELSDPDFDDLEEKCEEYKAWANNAILAAELIIDQAKRLKEQTEEVLDCYKEWKSSSDVAIATKKAETATRNVMKHINKDSTLKDSTLVPDLYWDALEAEKAARKTAEEADMDLERYKNILEEAEKFMDRYIKSTKAAALASVIATHQDGDRSNVNNPSHLAVLDSVLLSTPILANERKWEQALFNCPSFITIYSKWDKSQNAKSLMLMKKKSMSISDARSSTQSPVADEPNNELAVNEPTCQEEVSKNGGAEKRKQLDEMDFIAANKGDLIDVESSVSSSEPTNPSPEPHIETRKILHPILQKKKRLE